MADNTTLNIMTGGDVIADEDVGGAKYQKMKIVDGTPGSTVPLKVSSTGGMTVTVAQTLGVPVGPAGQPVMAVALAGQVDGEDVLSLLSQLLTEVRMTNYYLSNLSFNLNNGYDEQDTPEMLRGSNSIIATN